MCSSQCYLYSGPSFHRGTNHSPVHSGSRTECWGNQHRCPRNGGNTLDVEWTDLSTQQGNSLSLTASSTVPFLLECPTSCLETLASCSFKGEFYGPVWMANGARYPVLWQGKTVWLLVPLLNALMGMWFGSPGHMDVQRWLLGMVVLFAVKRDSHQFNALCIRACNCSCGWAGEGDTKVEALKGMNAELCWWYRTQDLQGGHKPPHLSNSYTSNSSLPQQSS